VILFPEKQKDLEEREQAPPDIIRNEDTTDRVTEEDFIEDKP
jgi:hypothetical protein